MKSEETIEEAIKELKDYCALMNGHTNGSSFFKSIEKAIEALEKEVPKTPIKFQDIPEDGYACYEYICSACGTEIDELVDYYCPNFCPNCGQAIDWETE